MSMDKQLSLSALSDELSQVRTKKREFLAEIDRIVPWEKWISIIKPYYYKGERGNEPYDLERMLRIYLVQNLYNLSDMAAVAEVIDSRAFSGFLRSRIKQSGTGRRYAGALSEHSAAQRDPAGTICTGCGTIDAARSDSEARHDSRLHIY